jgi:beta-galactosidase GanA
MKLYRIIISLCLPVLLAGTGFAQSSASKAPYLQKKGTATQLIVDGKPFLMLGGELANSSASSLLYMEPVWAQLAAQNLNTVLAPISWELLEPQEGKFDFTLVDGLIAAARKNNLKLVFLWFGSWKNTFSSYIPEWVKRDTKRFPRVLMKNGHPTERLTPLSESNRYADAKAFAALMKHIGTVDAGHTVLMMQVENEIGVIPESRDFSPEANAAFNAPVPAPLMDYIQQHGDRLEPELREAWVDAGRKTDGTWQEVFGAAPITDDFFMAWYYAAYLETIVAAGKAEYNLPMFTNAALIRPNYLPGQYNSGGPLPHSMDIYRAGSPYLDFIAPDIYFSNFAYWAGRYRREGNPVFIPETYGGVAGGANAFYAFGQLDAIGFSPFGIDRTGDPGGAASGQSPLASAYAVLDHLAPLIVEKQGTDQLSGIVLEGMEQRSGRISFGGYSISVNWAGFGGAQNGQEANRRIGIMFIQVGEDEFLIIGSGAASLSFASAIESTQTAGIASIDEEVPINGKWVLQRRLNGDENGQGQSLNIGTNTAVYKVRLYRY